MNNDVAGTRGVYQADGGHRLLLTLSCHFRSQSVGMAMAQGAERRGIRAQRRVWTFDSRRKQTGRDVGRGPSTN